MRFCRRDTRLISNFLVQKRLHSTYPVVCRNVQRHHFFWRLGCLCCRLNLYLSLCLHDRTSLVITLLCKFFFQSLDIFNSQMKKKKKEISGKKKDSYFFLPSLFLRHTPMFSFAAQGVEQELARQQGWVSCNWNWCNKLSELSSLHFLIIAHSGTVMHFPDSRWRRRWLTAKVWLHPEEPLPICNIYQSR